MRWLNVSGFALALAPILVVGLALASASQARPPFGGHHRDHGGPHHGSHGPPGFLEEHADRIGLDDETRQAIEAIVDESRAQGQELREQLEGLHEEMRDLLDQETPDEATVMQQADAIGKLETELHKHRLRAMIKIRALHTPEQLEELAEIREETRERWLGPLIEACEPDAEQYCPDDVDHWARRRCMREHWEELSADCRDAIEDARGAGRRGMRGGPGPQPMGEF
jgi:Spy/CpxP family protein refolding chaperone